MHQLYTTAMHEFFEKDVKGSEDFRSQYNKIAKRRQELKRRLKKHSNFIQAGIAIDCLMRIADRSMEIINAAVDIKA